MISTIRTARRCAGVSRYALAGIGALTLVTACEIPTKAPIIDTRWVVPSQGTRIAVANLLPAGVSILPDSSGFTLTATGASVTRTLGDDCAPCRLANGLTIPKPQFIANASAETRLPAEVSSATLTGGTLQVVIANGYNFDPLRPSVAGARGFAVITVSNGTNVVGKDSVNGATTALPAGGTLTRSIALSGPVSGSQPLTVSLRLSSPDGDPVMIDQARTLRVTATPTDLRVATASVAVTNRQVTSTSTIDLAGIDDAIKDKIQGGSLLLTTVNPFSVTGTLNVRLSTPGGAVLNKSVALATGTSSPAIVFTRDELRSLIGNVVTLTFSGPVSSAVPVTVSPRQAIVVTSRLDVNIRVGE